MVQGIVGIFHEYSEIFLVIVYRICVVSFCEEKIS